MDSQYFLIVQEYFATIGYTVQATRASHWSFVTLDSENKPYFVHCRLLRSVLDKDPPARNSESRSDANRSLPILLVSDTSGSLTCFHVLKGTDGQRKYKMIVV